MVSVLDLRGRFTFSFVNRCRAPMGTRNGFNLSEIEKKPLPDLPRAIPNSFRRPPRQQIPSDASSHWDCIRSSESGVHPLTGVSKRKTCSRNSPPLGRRRRSCGHHGPSQDGLKFLKKFWSLRTQRSEQKPVTEEFDETEFLELYMYEGV